MCVCMYVRGHKRARARDLRDEGDWIAFVYP